MRLPHSNRIYAIAYGISEYYVVRLNGRAKFEFNWHFTRWTAEMAEVQAKQLSRGDTILLLCYENTNVISVKPFLH